MKRLIGKIRAFFYVYSRSIVSPLYYKDILETRVNFTVKYYVTLAAVASFFTAVILSIQLIPFLNKAVDGIAAGAKEVYPDDFVLTIQDKQWSINQPEPYIVPIPGEFYKQITKDSEVKIPRNIIVFDKKGTIDDVYKHDTFALVNEKYILALDDANTVRSSPLQNLPNGRVDKAAFEGFVNQALGIKKFVPFFVAGGTLVFALFLNLVIRFISFIVVSMFVWGIAALLKMSLSYQQVLRITIHAGTLPVTVGVLSLIFRYSLPLPGWFSLVTLVYAIAVLYTIRNQQKPTVLE